MRTILLAGVILVGGVHPPGALHDWFQKQYSVGGAWCCDVADGYILADDDWDMGGPDNGYRVKIKDQWVNVPPQAIRDPKGGPNPTGQAIAWYATFAAVPPHIWCFSPGELY